MASKKKESSKTLLVSIALIAVVTLIALFVNFNVVGQAIKDGSVISSPPAKTIAFDELSTVKLDYASLNELEFFLQRSGENKRQLFRLNVNKSGDLVEYYVEHLSNKTKAVSEGEKVHGFLGSTLSSTGPLFLDFNDDIGDFELSLDGNYVVLTNPRFAESASAVVEAYDVKRKYLGSVIPVPFDKKKPVDFYILLNATSKTTPTVSAMIDGKAITLTKNTTGAYYQKMWLKFTPTKDAHSILKVNASVGGKDTIQEFVLAVNGNIFQRQVLNYPKVWLQQKGNKYTATYNLADTLELQPVALLCGELNLNDKQVKGKIEKVFAYQSGVKGWKENVPSEFNSLKANTGYLLKVTKGNTIQFKVECTKEPKAEIADLKSEWNLVGIGGFEKVAVPTGVTEVHEFSNAGAKKITTTSLEPGKVYWLKK